MGNLNIVPGITSKYYNLWICSQVKFKPSWKIVFICTSFTGPSWHSHAQRKPMVPPNGRAPCVFTSWSNSYKASHRQSISLWKSCHIIWVFILSLGFPCSQDYWSSTRPKIMGSCLLTLKWKCLKVHYECSSQSLGQLSWDKLLDKSLIYLRFGLPHVVRFFNPPFSNENKLIFLQMVFGFITAGLLLASAWKWKYMYIILITNNNFR